MEKSADAIVADAWYKTERHIGWRFQTGDLADYVHSRDVFVKG